MMMIKTLTNRLSRFVPHRPPIQMRNKVITASHNHTQLMMVAVALPRINDVLVAYRMQIVNALPNR